MGPNAAVGAGCILLACLTAQGEQLAQLMSISPGPSAKEAKGSVGEGEDLDVPLLPTSDVKRLSMSMLAEYGLEPSVGAGGVEEESLAVEKDTSSVEVRPGEVLNGFKRDGKDKEMTGTEARRGPS